ncbi:hypothetical protein [Sedimenticola selenatireducens]|uniref:hypothetical protein n=1 Tax=Sedimenticola selenatireducens TaxID=191960 RepID=UPI002AABB57F|nr:hypothetical protein [Sedimenticola selenatireducens]
MKSDIRIAEFVEKYREDRFPNVRRCQERLKLWDPYAELMRIDDRIIEDAARIPALQRRFEKINKMRANLITQLANGTEGISTLFPKPKSKRTLGRPSYTVLLTPDTKNQIVSFINYLKMSESEAYRQKTSELVEISARRETIGWMDLHEADPSSFDRYFKFNLHEFKLQYIRENNRGWEVPNGEVLWIHDHKLIRGTPSPWEWLAPAILESREYIGVCALDSCQQVFYKARSNKTTCSDRCRLTLAQRAYRKRNAGTSCADVK